MLLNSPEWLLFDFGAGHGAVPTAMHIVCGAVGNPSPVGCPRAWQLLGSHDAIKWEHIHSVDLWEYDNEYANGGITTHFVFATSLGRADGQACGSCDLGPTFTCHMGAYDGSCASKHCDDEGYCSSKPPCPPGEYMKLGFNSYGRPAFRCEQCQAGRFGNASGMTTAECSGLCAAGFYCLAGSTR